MKDYPPLLSGRFLRTLPDELKKRNRIRAIVCVILVVLSNFIAYFFPKIIEGSLNYFFFSTPLDEVIPLWPVFTVVYILAYFQWGFYWIRIIFDSDSVRYRYMSAEFLGKVVGMICFILIPVTMYRPPVEGKEFFSAFLRYIYSVDTPTCLFPSFHCFQSWMAGRYMWETRKNRPYTWVVTIFAGLVIASTLLIKQHLVLDAVGGILLAEFLLWLEKHVPLSSMMKKVMEVIVKEK